MTTLSKPKPTPPKRTSITPTSTPSATSTSPSSFPVSRSYMLPTPSSPIRGRAREIKFICRDLIQVVCDVDIDRLTRAINQPNSMVDYNSVRVTPLHPLYKSAVAIIIVGNIIDHIEEVIHNGAISYDQVLRKDRCVGIPVADTPGFYQYSKDGTVYVNEGTLSPKPATLREKVEASILTPLDESDYMYINVNSHVFREAYATFGFETICDPSPYDQSISRIRIAFGYEEMPKLPSHKIRDATTINPEMYLKISSGDDLPAIICVQNAKARHYRESTVVKSDDQQTISDSIRTYLRSTGGYLAYTTMRTEYSSNSFLTHELQRNIWCLLRVTGEPYVTGDFDEKERVDLSAATKTRTKGDLLRDIIEKMGVDTTSQELYTEILARIGKISFTKQHEELKKTEALARSKFSESLDDNIAVAPEPIVESAPIRIPAKDSVIDYLTGNAKKFQEVVNKFCTEPRDMSLFLLMFSRITVGKLWEPHMKPDYIYIAPETTTIEHQRIARSTSASFWNEFCASAEEMQKVLAKDSSATPDESLGQRAFYVFATTETDKTMALLASRIRANAIDCVRDASGEMASYTKQVLGQAFMCLSFIEMYTGIIGFEDAITHYIGDLKSAPTESVVAKPKSKTVAKSKVAAKASPASATPPEVIARAREPTVVELDVELEDVDGDSVYERLAKFAIANKYQTYELSAQELFIINSSGAFTNEMVKCTIKLDDIGHIKFTDSAGNVIHTSFTKDGTIYH